MTKNEAPPQHWPSEVLGWLVVLTACGLLGAGACLSFGQQPVLPWLSAASLLALLLVQFGGHNDLRDDQ